MPDTHYSRWTRRLHWLVFALVTAALVLIYVHGWAPKGTALRAGAKWAHMQFGIAILLVMLPRLVVRGRSRAPPITPPLPRWQGALARTMHLALYVLLIVTPLLGIANRLWDTGTWNFLGIPLPHVAAPDKAFSRMLESVHGTFGNLLMYLAAVHAAVALFHHYVQHDNVLIRMLPPADDAPKTPAPAREPGAP